VTVSKNPPLTEDQIRQSAKAEARHAAARASRHAQLDYMIAQQRQQQVARLARDDLRLRGGPLQGGSELDRGLSSPRHRGARSPGP
jgi:hypothetical protein